LALFCYDVTCVPLEWGIPILAALIGAPLLVFFLMRRRGGGGGGGGDTSESPIQQVYVWLQPVDEAGSLQMGDLLTGAERTEDTLMFWHPDWVDEEGNPYHAEVPIDRELPGRALDADRNVVEQWLVAKRGDDLEVVSFSTLANKIQARFDPLPANPRKVGRFYVGWPFGKTSGLQSLIGSTSGKLLAFGGVFIIGLFLGMLVIIAHVGHGIVMLL